LAVLPINVWGNGQRHSGAENYNSVHACINHRFGRSWKKGWWEYLFGWTWAKDYEALVLIVNRTQDGVHDQILTILLFCRNNDTLLLPWFPTHRYQRAPKSTCLNFLIWKTFPPTGIPPSLNRYHLVLYACTGRQNATGATKRDDDQRPRIDL